MEPTLQHHGILGMKWGVRRYQTKSGSLTPAGKKRYGSEGPKAQVSKGVGAKGSSSKGSSSEEPKKKTISEMSTEELRKTVERLDLEKRYRDHNPKTVTFGQKFVNNLKEGALSAVQESTKAVLKEALTNAGKSMLKSSEKKKNK